MSWILVALASVAGCGGDGGGTSPDGEAPTVSLTAPGSGTVQGTITLTAEAHDNRAVSAVQFYLGNTQLGTDDLASPYTMEWNSSGVANGEYSLLAKARDAAGNIASSTAVTLSVSNAPPAPTTGVLEVITSTTGPDADGNGYSIVVDGVARGAIPSNGTANLSNITAGARTVTLFGVAGNCSVEGSHPRQITVIAGGSAQLAFSIVCTAIPVPERIAFWSNGGTAGIYTMTTTGSDIRRLASGTSPAWSPDRTKLAYTSNVLGSYNIYVMNANGTGQTTLTPNDGAHKEMPRWSPDGTKIVFKVGGDIYVMNADGTGISNITNTLTLGEDWPAWSPDGSRIVFTTNESGNDDIWVMNADGTNRVQLTTHLAVDYAPSWSPDGSKIAFTSPRDEAADDVWVMNADGTQQTRLTNEAGTDRNPAWSLDGTRIAFSSRRDGWEDIFVINVDGTGLVNLTNTPNFPDEDRLPAWAP